ncbi:acyltransferase family-domain-containing protein [Cadophora sp. MPI-SDFR-AT-0126]|nr:acyltransferase family-domain-containing protein [Leotiomycetes sp. MPI-SDFR-AT-0126]
MGPFRLLRNFSYLHLQRVPDQSSLVQTAQSLLSFTVPSFLADNPAKPAPLRPLDPHIAAQRASTDCLDGLRGVAAFIVMIFHYTQYGYPRLRQVYGFEGRHHLVQLPIIKLCFSGGFMVFLFFVISGYVLSARVVRLMVQEKRGRILKVLTSMTFRRVVRLGLPSLVASFIGFLFHRLGLRGKPTNEYQPGFVNDTVFYFQALRKLFTFYNWAPYMIWHLDPLWSIAVEFRCSMVLFLVLLGVAHCRRVPRLVVEGLILVDNVIHDRWDMACFMFGLVIAELHIYSQEKTNPHEEGHKESVQDIYSLPTRQSGEDSGLAKFGLWATFVVGLYLGSVPTEGTCTTPGYRTLCKLTRSYPEPWRYIALPGSFLVIFSLMFLPTLQKPLASPLARYLGRLGYAVYLVHELVNMSIGQHIREFGWAMFGREGLGYHVGFVVGLGFFVCLCVWLADMFMRAVDVPAVHFAKWLEEQCFVRSYDNSNVTI